MILILPDSRFDKIKTTAPTINIFLRAFGSLENHRTLGEIKIHIAMNKLIHASRRCLSPNAQIEKIIRQISRIFTWMLRRKFLKHGRDSCPRTNIPTFHSKN